MPSLLKKAPMQDVTSNRWVSEPRNGFAGYRCKECNTWKHASQFLNCDCDKETQFIVAGPVVNEEQTYWNNDRQWVTFLAEATTFPHDILTSPLPIGSSGIMELTLLGEYVRFLKTLPRGESGH